MSKKNFLEQVGQHWVPYTASKPELEPMLRTLGKNFPKALASVNSLHVTVSRSGIYPGLSPPQVFLFFFCFCFFVFLFFCFFVVLLFCCLFVYLFIYLFIYLFYFLSKINFFFLLLLLLARCKLLDNNLQVTVSRLSH